MIRAAIFDLDGTLVDSLPGIAGSLNRSLAGRNHAVHPLSAVRGFIGNGSWMLCRRGLDAAHPDAEADEVNRAFMADYDATWSEGTTPFPGVIGMLDELRKAGMPIAVLSNKPHAFTQDIVESLFGSGRFEAVLGHRPGIEQKPQPDGALEIAAGLDIEPSEIAFIGDSVVDLETARNAGMQPLLVSWGYGADLGDAPLFEDCSQLLAHLRTNAR